MKKYFIIIILSFLFAIPLSVSAQSDYYYVWDDPDSNDPISIRTGPSTSYELIGKVYEGGVIKVTDTVNGSLNDGCKEHVWFKMEYGNISGYSCKYWYKEKEVNNDAMVDETYDFEAELSKFPISYQKYLTELHTIHPTWKFYAESVNVDFNNVIDNLNESRISLIQVGANTNGYGYLWQNESVFDYKTNQYFNYDGGYGWSNYGWFIPNDQTIGYYIDPRNYLNETNVFVFLNQRFSADETITSIASITKGTFMSGSYQFKLNDVDTTKTYNETFYEAGQAYNVSSVMLASRVRQEIIVGDKDGDGLLDASDSASGILDADGNRYYNFFNIGAGSGANSIDNALAYAKKKGWTNPYLSIFGGASMINGEYISNNQYTNYYQKFNVLNQVWVHQYMQNIQAPMSESITTYKSYLSNGTIDSNLTFYIPVFNNMPTSTILPSKYSPNNYLVDLKIDGTTIEDFDGTKDTYTINIPFDKKSINIAATQATSLATITSGNGLINLDLNTKSFKLNIEVKAQDGTPRTYTININRLDDPSGIVYPKIDEIMTNTGLKYTNYGTDIYCLSGINLNVTVDRIKEIFNEQSKYIEVSYIKNANNNTNFIATNDTVVIKSGVNSYTLNVVLLGDTNGDAKIDLLDLVQVRKRILNAINFDAVRAKAGDTNKDGVVDLLDLIKIRKHILGTSIEQ